MPEKMTQKKVAAIIAAGKAADVRDTHAKGLVLRVLDSGRWSWNVRRYFAGKSHRLDLGDCWSLDEARDLAGEVDRCVRANMDPWIMSPGGWFDHFDPIRRRKLGIEKPAVAPTPHVTKVPDRGPVMLWKDAATLWVEDLAIDKRPPTVNDYRKTLNVAELRRFREEYVSEITVEMVAAAIEDVRRRGVEQQARHVYTIAKLFFDWMGSARMRATTGVKAGVLRDLEKPRLTLIEDDDAKAKVVAHTRVPNRADLARIVRFLLDPKAIATDGRTLNERDKLGALLTLYTVQRRMSVAQARRRDFEPAALGGLWTVPPAHRKTASEHARKRREVGVHVVPLPPRAWAVVQRLMAMTDGDYLFPPMRQRRAGLVSVRVDESFVTHAFLGIPGNACGPHDMRRGFGTTYGNVVDMSEEVAKAVYDHRQGVRSGDVTRTFYMFRDGSHRLWPVMQGWVDFLHECADTP